VALRNSTWSAFDFLSSPLKPPRASRFPKTLRLAELPKNGSPPMRAYAVIVGSCAGGGGACLAAASEACSYWRKGLPKRARSSAIGGVVISELVSRWWLRVVRGCQRRHSWQGRPSETEPRSTPWRASRLLITYSPSERSPAGRATSVDEFWRPHRSGQARINAVPVNNVNRHLPPAPA
jgi:hypothetical protein